MSDVKTKRFLSEVYDAIKRDPDKNEVATSDQYLKELLEDLAYHPNGRGFSYNLIIALEDYLPNE